MKFLISPFTSPHFNLALEELFFEERQADILLIYINDDSVVVGKHQNAVAEINASFLHKNKIPVIRRFSGGGTVFHDTGNINFSFITTGDDSRVIDFKKYAMPVVDFLRSLGANASLTERNDIFIDGKKVSGHAAHARGTRALHHGTLLFNSDLKRLSMGLSDDKEKFKSRAVMSVRSPVTNIVEHLDEQIRQEEFVAKLINHLRLSFDISEEYEIGDLSVRRIEELANSKYQMMEWNYGYSPDYSFEVNEGDLHFTAHVKKGIFDTFEFHQQSDFWEEVKGLIGQYHTYMVVSSYLSNCQLSGHPGGQTVDCQLLLDHFFATKTPRHQDSQRHHS